MGAGEFPQAVELGLRVGVVACHDGHDDHAEALTFRDGLVVVGCGLAKGNAIQRMSVLAGACFEQIGLLPYIVEGAHVIVELRLAAMVREDAA